MSRLVARPPSLRVRTTSSIGATLWLFVPWVLVAYTLLSETLHGGGVVFAVAMFMVLPDFFVLELGSSLPDSLNPFLYLVRLACDFVYLLGLVALFRATRTRLHRRTNRRSAQGRSEQGRP